MLAWVTIMSTSPDLIIEFSTGQLLLEQTTRLYEATDSEKSD